MHRSTWFHPFLFIALCHLRPSLAEPALAELVLRCGEHEVICEVADTEQSRSRGLMGRLTLPTGRGMLFVFERPQRLAFWMRDTPLPLSIAYLDEEGVVEELYDLQPFSEQSVLSTSRSLLFALEVPQGWFHKAGIIRGMRFQGLEGLSKKSALSDRGLSKNVAGTRPD
jgi:uncharacterized membrane protein (UPF0127 family)